MRVFNLSFVNGNNVLGYLEAKQRWLNMFDNIRPFADQPSVQFTLKNTQNSTVRSQLVENSAK